jgi:hypothetical protein
MKLMDNSGPDLFCHNDLLFLITLITVARNPLYFEAILCLKPLPIYLLY